MVLLNRRSKLALVAFILIVLATSMWALFRGWRTGLGLDRPLNSVLPDAWYVTFEIGVDKDEWLRLYRGSNIEPIPSPESFAIRINPSENQEILEQIRNTHIFLNKGAKETSNCVVYVHISQPLCLPTHAYVYLPNTGELGKGDDWAIVTPQLKAWLNKRVIVPK